MADAHAKPHHDYHLVDPSPWPAIGSVSAFILAVGAITWMHHSFAGAPYLFGRSRRGRVRSSTVAVAKSPFPPTWMITSSPGTADFGTIAELTGYQAAVVATSKGMNTHNMPLRRRATCRAETEAG